MYPNMTPTPYFLAFPPRNKWSTGGAKYIYFYYLVLCRKTIEKISNGFAKVNQQ